MSLSICNANSVSEDPDQTLCSASTLFAKVPLKGSYTLVDYRDN